jgi:hypothetical protein
MAEHKSTYQRKGKQAHRYSELYYQWRAAVARGDKEAVRDLARRHTKLFMPEQLEKEAA